jgi:hypothetical protein
MAKKTGKIDFQHKGIGEVLLHRRLRVPPNQREYSWQESHVEDLVKDFNHAISQGPVEYFLGTIVLTLPDDTEVPEVADGQQRLATTTMVLASIRDYFYTKKEHGRANSIQPFLGETDTLTEEILPKLRLNIDDHEFFMNHVLLNPDDPRRKAATITKHSKESHKRIAGAAKFIRQYFIDLLALQNETSHAQVLNTWKEFIKHDAKVIQLIVPDHLNAFMMFETLNDRGLRASEADLLKNYLFQLAGDRIEEAHQRWAKMIGTLESLGVEGVVMDYLRHSTICQYGPTTQKEVYDKIRTSVRSKTRALEFLSELAAGAAAYSALFSESHVIWNEYGPSARGHLRTLIVLRQRQIRALMLAVLRRFTVAETRKAMRLFVAWSVRFLVAGGGRGGLLDERYGELAAAVTHGEVNDAHALAEKMKNTVAGDNAFLGAFGDARVSQSHLARYYLRALERHAKGQTEPEWIPNDDEDALNLEHVLPETPGDEWDIEPEISDGYFNRLGNMVLLPASKNVAAANKGFATKRGMYAQSGLMLTAEVAEETEWGVEQIIARQIRLAQLAVETWSIGVTKPTKGGKLPKAG